MSDTMDAGGDVGADTGGSEDVGGEPITGTSPAVDEGTTEDAQVDEGVDTESEPVEETLAEETEALSMASAKKLREENHGLRERAKGYDAAFEGMPDDHRGAMLESAKLLSENPQAWADEMAGIVEAIRGQAEPEEPGLDPNDDETPLTARQLESYLAKRDSTREAERTQAESLRQAQEAINSEMKELGYDLKSSDEGIRTRSELVTYLALHKTGGDINKAHALLEADRRAAVKTVRNTKAAQAAGSPTVVQGQPGAEAGQKLKFGSPEWKKQFASG